MATQMLLCGARPLKGHLLSVSVRLGLDEASMLRFFVISAMREVA